MSVSEVHITISDKSGKSNAISTRKTAKPEIAEETKEDGLSQSARTALLIYAANKAKKAVTNVVEREFAHSLSLKEDYMGENIYRNTVTTLSKFASLGGAIVAGANVGGPVGVAIGSGAWTINEVVSYNSRMSEYYQRINAANIETSFQRTRAGLTDGSRGTEN